ncbi:MAG: hypothetical protein ACFFFG_15435 [Candidatus Thorarchaeota archaeon]
MALENLSRVSFSDMERIDLRIRVKSGIASIFGKIYLHEKFDVRVFGFEEKVLEKDLESYLEKVGREASENGIDFRSSVTKWGWLWTLEKKMWAATSGEVLSPHRCPACVLMEGSLRS